GGRGAVALGGGGEAGPVVGEGDVALAAEPRQDLRELRGHETIANGVGLEMPAETFPYPRRDRWLIDRKEMPAQERIHAVTACLLHHHLPVEAEPDERSASLGRRAAKPHTRTAEEQLRFRTQGDGPAARRATDGGHVG